jgi:SAM-dependent methyltransferase
VADIFRRWSRKRGPGAIGGDARALRLCPLCGATGEELFVPHGRTQRRNARCRECGSLERHRLVWAYLLETELFEGARKKVLHIAPEPVIRDHLERHPKVDYLSGDLRPGKAMVEMDITAMPWRDGSFDFILCSHVLEHVPDDRRALSELLRVLAPGGWAILAVPIRGEHTYEDPSITSPEERERQFGQSDHVRKYGSRDFPERIRSAGFEVTVDPFPRRVLGRRRARQMGIRIDDAVHVCKKRRLPAPPDPQRRPAPG